MTPLLANFLAEAARSTPVVWEGDLCVAGGSCTGVFAAVRAARLGLSVALVEENVIFGGMATAAQVNEWHSLDDIHDCSRIIGGLTVEILDRLRVRGALLELPAGQRGRFRFNSAELAAELDELVTANRIRPFLAARCVTAVRDGPRVLAAVIEDKSGRRALRAARFIDATGDGDLLRRAGFTATRSDRLQPVSAQALVGGLAHREAWSTVSARAYASGYPLGNSAPWFMDYPGSSDLVNVYGPRMSGVDGSDAEHLTTALLAGRRHIRTLLDTYRATLKNVPVVIAWPHALGVRQTWQATCLHRLTGEELMRGQEFPDTIARGTYPIDIHHSGGTLLRYLDGREEIVAADGSRRHARWRNVSESPACYHIPYRCLVPREAENLLVAGRLLDADTEAFGGVRVMVNMNQTGEAVGVAAALSLGTGRPVAEVAPEDLVAALREGGSCL